MHQKIKQLLDLHFPDDTRTDKLRTLASELDLLFQQQENEITLLERSIDLASDAMLEREDAAVEHQELFEITFEASSEAMLIVDFRKESVRYNAVLGELMSIPNRFGGEMTMPDFLQNLSSQLETPENFLSFLRHSHDNHAAFTGELLLKDSRWLYYNVQPIIRAGEMVGRLWTLADVTEKKQAERQIVEFQQELKHAHELAKIGEWTFDCSQQTFVFTNDVLELFGLSESHKSLTLDAFLALLEDEHGRDLAKQFRHCQVYGQTIQAELQFDLEGRDCYVILRGRLKVGSRGQGDIIQGVLQDISDLRTSEHLVKISSHFFQSSMQGNVLMGRDRDILDFNEVACGIFKLSAQEFSSRIAERLATAWTHEMPINDIWRTVIETNHWAGEVYFTCPELVDKTIWLSLEALRDNQGKVVNFIAIFNDITESKNAQEQLHHMAYFDAQTALPNRFQFEQFLSQKLSAANLASHPMTLFYLDLDRFKFVNDSLGHHAGDQLLYLVGQRLMSAVPNATLVARQGGDEFVMLLTGQLTRAQQEQVAEHLIAQLSEVFTVFDTQVYIGASIGVVNLPQDAQDRVTAMRYADISLYEAKKSGKGCYVFWQRDFLKGSTPERVQMESELREAILKDELVLHFQPKVEAQTGKVYAFEALVRWNHPRLGLVYPDRFIGIAEESNLIIELDRWVLNAVVSQLTQWHQSGLPILEVSVNISAAHVTRLGLLDVFRSFLDQYPYLSECLEIELTETAIMADPDQATVVLNKLREWGVKASVDDFGSGYTSLGYLKKLNAHTLKIDRSFIDGITYDVYDRDVAKAIIALASSLSMDVVAEGVETQDQWDLLQAFGCKYLQGYFFSRPQCAQDIESDYLRPLQLQA
ncbi:Cyclic di-GMP phosphodiesterase Gmr [Marinomonas aquimarina]|uniref:Cyclic di-GMP phosphodiesterase Gmr n=1 Tax=Marinomonas aquimarina TaxID=295068 RepID=A0A1A8T3J4_9GAMM|nr:bifunctional diguanylate cyclase/phosphodiesterase [Marinomonas aquimarina]SBS26404.1 Cyclic di-GMP phosphodiesterase Gmr [Marinomonas aquimarina]